MKTLKTPISAFIRLKDEFLKESRRTTDPDEKAVWLVIADACGSLIDDKIAERRRRAIVASATTKF
jgi:hypothetical protein